MNRKLKYLYVSKEFMAQVLKSGVKTVYDGIPNDATIMNIEYNPMYDVYYIVVHSETFRELAECELMERLKNIRVITR